MLERSSARELLVLALACALAGACGKSGPKKPEVDPAEVTKLATRMAREVPAIAAVRDCTPEDYNGTVTLSFRSLTQLTGKEPSRLEDAPWTNPAELDTPAVRAILDSKDKTAARRAAAELLAAPAFVVYRIDLINAPMALGVKELKIGTLSGRVIRYEKTGLPGCVQIFHIQNTQQVSDDAIEISDKAEIDPAVAKILREDLTANLIKQLPRGQPKSEPRQRSD
jgi:hypothetical protein